MEIGFIGVGTMGRPLAMRALGGGHRVVVFDTDEAAVTAMVEAGAGRAGSIADAVRGRDVVITVLPDAPDVEAVALGPGGLLETIQPPTLYVDMSTIDPATTRRVAARMAGKGISMIDAPVTRSVDDAWAGRVALLVGGDPAVLEEVRPVFACMADTITHCGPIGNGSAMKLVNNFLGAGLVALASEALTFGMKSGLDLPLILEATGRTNVANGVLHKVMPSRAFHGDFSPGFMTRLAHKDQRLALAMAREAGVETPLGETVLALLAEAAARFPADDFTSLLKLREQASGVEVRLDGATGTPSDAPDPAAKAPGRRSA